MQGKGRAGRAQVVSVRSFYSNDPSSNHAEVYSFYSLKLFEKYKNKQKEVSDSPFKNACRDILSQGNTRKGNTGMDGNLWSLKSLFPESPRLKNLMLGVA